MPRPPNTAVGGPGVRQATYRVSPWQAGRSRGGAAGGREANGAATAPPTDDDGQSDADDPAPSPPPSPPAVSGGTSADEEPDEEATLAFSGPALFAYYPPGVVPPPLPGVAADPAAGAPAVAGRLVDGATGTVLHALGSVLPDAALAGVPADCSFSAGDRLVALGLHGPRDGGGHVSAVLAQATGGDAASLLSPPPDGPRGREARALLCGAGCAPARGGGARLRFVCEELLVGPAAVAHLASTAPIFLTDPPPFLNTGTFELRGWPQLAEGEAAHGAPAPAGPPVYGPGDPEWDPDLDG